MVHVAGSGHGRSHPLADRRSHFKFVIAVIFPHVHPVPRHKLGGRFDRFPIEFDVPGAHGLGGVAAGFEDANGPRPCVDSYWCASGGGHRLVIVFVVDDLLDLVVVHNPTDDGNDKAQDQ